MRRLLPLSSPPLTGYLHHAFPLSILAGRRHFHPWLYGQYIQLSCPGHYDFERVVKQRFELFDFYNHPDYSAVHPFRHVLVAPFLESHWLDRRLVVRTDGLTTFLVEAIGLGYYVEACVDAFYVPGSDAYQERHSCQEVLVSGFDSVSESFVVSIGFDRSGDYTIDELTFDEVERAIASADLKGHTNQLGLCLLRPIPEISHELDTEWILAQLEDYVWSKNSSRRFAALRNHDTRFYGLATYEWLERYFRFLRDRPDCTDVRPIHIFWEHKKLMMDRLRYLEARGVLFGGDGFSDRYERLATKAGVLRMMLLKARLTRDPSIVERIADGVGQMGLEEREVLLELIEALDLRNRCSGVREAPVVSTPSNLLAGMHA